jgi:murein DD-endopeptidase MepM/ murein hydrolase activator NlpD
MKREAFIIIFLFLLKTNLSFAGGTNPKDGEKPSYLKEYKKITKSELIYLIDSLLEKEVVSSQEIGHLHYLSGLLKDKDQATYETDLDDLEHLHFYSDSEEKRLFPVFPFDEMPEEFNLLLENPQSQNYINPFNGVITSYFGWRDKRMHKGIDIDLNKGEPVMAAFDGKVRIAEKNKGGFGNVVIIMHANGLETVYAHLSKIKVKPGQIVLSGQTIGLGGNTGRSRGSHLHFETRYKGYALNPLCFINYHQNKLFHHTITLKKIKKELLSFPSNAEIHIVKKGETLSSLAMQHNTSINQILALNGKAKRFYLKPGSRLRIN